MAAICPAHAVASQARWLKSAFPERFAGGWPDLDLPLFPDERGQACTKQAVTATIQHAARLLGLEAHGPAGEVRWTGHSLRVTGAQGLARAGFDVWAIQLLGRWGSDAVLRYTREAPLAVSGSWAARASAGLPLGEVHRRVLLETGDEQGPAKRARAAAPAGGARPAHKARRCTADSLCQQLATKVSSLEASVLSLREASRRS